MDNSLYFDRDNANYANDEGMHAYADVEFATSQTVEALYNEEFDAYEDEIDFHSEANYANQYSF
ncbi:hypothetical protein NV379_04155 [Paenibacillus sp. N1-5-1-14]|uniref:hypothetical protein n=1 Tax=Paenibacillus radicibacter TaxID=2972488 RepID=UPI002159410A|nr:hypothetical protein [Paenibacillus radicibacter]MCR8641845.1 hypothetical protein [Paenibacillus radicibacter]